MNTCAVCKAPLRDYWEITQTERGVKTGWVRLCSLLCILKWAPKHGMRRVQGAAMKIAGALQGRK